MINRLFSQTSRLLQFQLKKDRRAILIWLISFIVTIASVAFYYGGIPMTETEKLLLLETLKSPAMILLVGVAPSVAPTSGMMFALEMTLFTVIIVAIMNIFFVSTNTRNDEENGRTELIRALPTGRLSVLSASLIQAFIINLLLAVFVGLSFIFVDLGDNTLQGGLTFGLVLGASGFFFATMTAFWAQIFQSNRTVMIASFAFLGFNFLFRGITDIQAPQLSWLSPLAWSYLTESFVSNHMFPIFLMFITGLIIALISLYLNAIRDLDGSFIKQKTGRIEAQHKLLRPFGLMHNLNRTTLISWIIGTLMLGFTFGYTFGDIKVFFSNNEFIRIMFPDTTGVAFAQQYIGMIATLFSIFIAIPPLTFLGRILAEEKKGRIENILTKAKTKTQLLWTHLIYAVMSLVLFTIIAIGSIYGTATNDIVFSDIALSILAFIPAIIFTIGMGVFIIGTLPKLYALIWLYLGYAFFVVYFGNMLKMPDWLKNVSTFNLIPLLPFDNISLVPLVVLTGLGIALTLIGFKTYRHRDIA